MAVTPAQLIEEATREGCRFVLDGDRIGLSGDPVAVAELAPRLRPYRSALLAALRLRERHHRKAWRVHVPGRPPFGLICVQGCTREELLLRYPEGTKAEALK